MNTLKFNKGEDLFRFQCKAMKLPKVTEQFQFALPRLFRADFCFEDYDLLVEICGGIYRAGGGAHSRPAKIEGDMERTQHAVINGFWMLPFTPDDVKSGHAIDWTQRVLYKLGWRP